MSMNAKMWSSHPRYELLNPPFLVNSTTVIDSIVEVRRAKFKTGGTCSFSHWCMVQDSMEQLLAG